jgi:RHS repeat-associated protein
VVPTSIHAGSSVNASWSNIVVPAFTDWIGLFVPGASASNYISWRNTNGLASGSVPFTIPVGQKPGTYELRLYQTGNVLLATSSNLTVTTPPPPAISATPSSTPAGSSVTAAWSNIVTPAATDWIGLFVPGASNSSYSAWQYTTGTASGSMPFAIPIAQTPGAYELRLFQAGSVLRATGSSFAITPAPPPALSVSPTEVAAGDSVTAAWSNIIAPASSDWVGLFVPGNPDSAFISWRNTTGASSGSVPFSIPAAQALGNYELRLFQAGPILRATSNTFAVVPPPTVYFIHPDHLNSARAVYNDQQQLVWLHDQAEPFGNNPPDENPSGLGVFEFPLRESNYYDDKETGSFYAMQRDCYVPGLGRFCQSDPIGLGDGLNTYSYVRGNPLRGVDPFGLDTLVYKGGVLTHYDSSGNLVGSYAATSGVPGITDSSIRNQGPIPEGRYTVNPGEISPAGFVRRFLGDWGDYRVPAHADPGTQTFGRSGFFIHGGKEPGSAGCIDVGRADKTFFPRLRRVNEPVPLVVVR